MARDDVSPLRLVLETALDATVVMGADGRVRDWNRLAEATFGWSRLEAVGQLMSDLIIPQPHRSAHEAGLRRYLEEGTSTLLGRRIEITALHREGRLFPVELAISPIEEHGQLAFIGFVRDISDRLTTQQALETERSRSQNVLDNMLDAFVLLDRDLAVIQVNKAALRMEDLSVEGVVGRPHEEVWPGAIAHILRQRYREVLETQIAVTFEQRWGSEQSEVWLEVRVQPTPEGLAIFYRDVSKRRAAEEVLRASQSRLQTLADVVPAMVWMASEQGQVEFLNERWFAFTGAPTNDPLLNTEVFIHPDDKDRVTTGWVQAMEAGARYENEMRLRRADGQYFWFLTRAEPLHALDGHVSGWIGASINIDERRRDQERLQLMVNELNHRVKNNLAAVQALAAQTFRGTESLPKAREAFTSRLMALAKAHDILTRQQWEGTQLAEVAQETLAPNIPRPEALSINGPAVTLGPNAALTLSMALHELCTNALKYGALSSPHGLVALSWSVEGLVLHLSWTERGGPPVTPPSSSGFGTRLLTRSLAAELRGQVSIAYHQDGVVCTIDAPLDAGRLGPPAGPA